MKIKKIFAGLLIVSSLLSLILSSCSKNDITDTTSINSKYNSYIYTDKEVWAFTENSDNIHISSNYFLPAYIEESTDDKNALDRIFFLYGDKNCFIDQVDEAPLVTLYKGTQIGKTISNITVRNALSVDEGEDFCEYTIKSNTEIYIDFTCDNSIWLIDEKGVFGWTDALDDIALEEDVKKGKPCVAYDNLKDYLKQFDIKSKHVALKFNNIVPTDFEATIIFNENNKTNIQCPKSMTMWEWVQSKDFSLEGYRLNYPNKNDIQIKYNNKWYTIEEKYCGQSPLAELSENIEISVVSEAK